MAIAQNAAYYQKVAAVLTSWGWAEFINWWPGWATRSNAGATMVPQAVTVHHTGGTATATSYLVNPTDRPQLKVLANIHIDMLERRIRFICAGGASHGGYTHQACYDRIIAGTAPLDRDLVPGADSKTFSINKRTVGIEVDGAGGADEWDEWTYRAAVATSAACQVAGGWPAGDAPRVGAHKEHTRRKPGDPWAPMGQFRRDVLDCIRTPWAPKGAAAADRKLGSRLLSKRPGQDTGPDVAELAALLTAKGYDIGQPDTFGPRMDAAIRDVQAKAGLTVDGIVGPDTLTVLPGQQNPSQPDGGSTAPLPEEPMPETPATAVLLLGVANCQSYDGDRSEKAWKARAAIIAKQKWTVVAAVETSKAGRKVMLAELKRLTGHTWKTETVSDKSVAVLWNDTIWAARKPRVATYGPTAFGHGAVCVPLVHRATGLGVDVIAGHTRPGTVATTAQKDADIREGAGLAKGWPAVFAGDFNRNDPKLPAGWIRGTRKVDTLDKPGVQTIDGAYVKGAIGVGKTTVVDPGALSDHTWLGVALMLGGSTT